MIKESRRPFYLRMVDRTRRRKRERSTYVCFTKYYDMRVTFKTDRYSLRAVMDTLKLVFMNVIHVNT